ncbi:hypothetical protein ACFYSC_06340 [Streptosporangium sp. NPDC004379]|uniref:hypothetical protein n=1 Tax=Streptosporangium sp. NPDC004379 TaxID=3366189 RepID=UPI00367B261F
MQQWLIRPGGNVPDDIAPQRTVDPRQYAELLQRELEQQGVVADVHVGHELALVSVWVGLVVWCNGDRFWWQAGWDEQCGRPAYASRPVSGVEEVARLVAVRCTELRRVRFGERTDPGRVRSGEQAEWPRAQADERATAPEPERPQGPV